MMNEASYQQWRTYKLDNYPRNSGDLVVDVGGLLDVSEPARAAILARCKRFNMAVYRCRNQFSDRAAVGTFAASFGLTRFDHHMCTHADGVSELSVAVEGTRSDYVPYSNRGLSWHTDGYYNAKSRQVRSIVLHCAQTAATGGENALLDFEIAYILLRDENPDFITALEHPECMTIPANPDAEGGTRPAACGPVFTHDADSGALHMRFSARKKNIHWRDDRVTRQARQFLAELLADESGPVLRYRLQPGEGLISNNVLHNRTAFADGPEQQRLLYRARFFDRIESS